MRTAAWAIAIFTGALANAAAAQDAPPAPRPDRWQQVVECRRETNDKARLACMDAAVAALEAAEANHEVVVIDRSHVEKEQRKRFGLPRRESVAEASVRPLRPETIGKYQASVLQAFQSSFLHEWIFWLSDGSVWRQHGDEEIFRKPHKGSTVEISRGVLGNFFLAVDRGFAIPVNRIR